MSLCDVARGFLNGTFLYDGDLDFWNATCDVSRGCAILKRPCVDVPDFSSEMPPCVVLCPEIACNVACLDFCRRSWATWISCCCRETSNASFARDLHFDVALSPGFALCYVASFRDSAMTCDVSFLYRDFSTCVAVRRDFRLSSFDPPNLCCSSS